MGDDALGERVRDLAPGRRAAGMHDAGPRVSALETEARIELDSQVGEVGDARRRFARQNGDGARAAETAARARSCPRRAERDRRPAPTAAATPPCAR